MERAQVLRDDYGPRTHEMQRMSRTLDLLQKTELFGAVFWFARQVAVPVDQTCVSGAPDLTFCVDPRNPEQDVCVYVSLHGVFVIARSPQSKESQVFSFPYRLSRADRELPEERRPPRLLKWGARPPPPPRLPPQTSRGVFRQSVPATAQKGLLQLVVLAPDPLRAWEGHVNQLLTLECQQAVDVAYAIHRAVADSTLPGGGSAPPAHFVLEVT